MLPRPRHNLTAQPSSYIGREPEIADVKALLTTPNGGRLHTLTGSGGSGKTRLALRAAEDLLDDYPDRVWLTELAQLSDPELVAQAVASTLNVREVQGQALVTTLCTALQDKHLLLILDNCEHQRPATWHPTPCSRRCSTVRVCSRTTGETTERLLDCVGRAWRCLAN